MEYDRMWERLLEYLNEWGAAREVPGGIEITFEAPGGGSRTVEAVVTLDDWDEYASVMYGTGDPRRTPLKQELLATPVGVPYLVYDTYEWWPSHTRELPQEEAVVGPGEWVAVDGDGNTTSRFADFYDDQ